MNKVNATAFAFARAVFIDPPSRHFALAFDLHDTAATELDGRKLLAENFGRHVGAMDTVALGIAFHTRRRVDDISKEAPL